MWTFTLSSSKRNPLIPPGHPSIRINNIDDNSCCCFEFFCLLSSEKTTYCWSYCSITIHASNILIIFSSTGSTLSSTSSLSHLQSPIFCPLFSCCSTTSTNCIRWLNNVLIRMCTRTIACHDRQICNVYSGSNGCVWGGELLQMAFCCPITEPSQFYY